MKNDIVAKYTLRFNDLASKGLLRKAGAARVVTRALKTAALASAALAAVGAAAAVRYAHSWAKSTDELGKFAKKSGIAIEALSNLHTAMELQGGSAADVQTGIDTLNKRIGEMRQKTGALYTFLKSSGDTAFAAQIKGAKSTGEALSIATEKLASLTNAQDRAALGAALFGRTAGASFDLLTKDGVKALDELMAEVERVRPALTPEHAKMAAAYNDQLLFAKQAMLSLGDAGAGQLLPTLTKLSKQFTDFVVNNHELINTKITAFVNAFSKAIQKIDFDKTMESLSGFGRGLITVAGYAEKFVDAIGGPENAVKLFAASMVAAKIAPFLSILGGIATVGGKAWPFLAKLGPVFKGIASGALLVGKAMIPLIASLGAPILIIGALIAAGALLWANWDTVKAHAKSLGLDLDAVWSGIQAEFTHLKNAAIVIFDVIKFAMTDPIGAAKAIVIGYITSLKTIWTMIMTGIGSVASGVWSGIKSAFESGTDFIKSKLKFLTDAYNSAVDLIGGEKINIFSEAANDNKLQPYIKQFEISNDSAKTAAQTRQQAGQILAGVERNNTVTIRAEKGTEVANVTGDSAGFNPEGRNFSFG